MLLVELLDADELGALLDQALHDLGEVLPEVLLLVPRTGDRIYRSCVVRDSPQPDTTPRCGWG